MRFAPVAAALSLFLATTASVTSAGEQAPDPRAERLVQQGEASLAGGDAQTGALEQQFAAAAQLEVVEFDHGRAL